MTATSDSKINDLDIRNCQPQDHSKIISVMKNWWHGRDLTYALPKLFFIHFADSSFVAYQRDQLAAFLVGFLSQSRRDEGYIHFAGVNPTFRGQGLGSHLYHRFFDYCRLHDRKVVRSCTSPVNKGSIEFHTKLGFKIAPGDTVIDGVSVNLDYNRPDDPKVLFYISL